MQDFVYGELFEEGLGHGCHRDRIPNGIEDLNRMAYLSSIRRMAVNNSCHISTSKILFLKVSRERDLLK